MELRFTPPHARQQGSLASMLKRSYAELVEADEEHWGGEVLKWEEFDHDVFEHLDTIGECVFLSWADEQLVGFASYDPRQQPELGIIGHNCVMPEFRCSGFGRQQIREIIGRFRASGISRARVLTLDHPFFIPARRMYIACGFRETGRQPWHGDPSRKLIEYDMRLDNALLRTMH